MATGLFISATAIILASRGSSLRRPLDVALMVLLTLLAFASGDFSLPAFRLDIGMVMALAAIILTGPIGALLVLLVPELIRPLIERHPVRPIATVTNLASFAWAVLAAHAVLLALPTAHASPAARLFTFALAAMVMGLLNVIVVRGILGALVDRVSLSGWRMELGTLVATLALAPFAAITAYLIPSLGLLALIVTAIAALLPGVLVHLVTWTPQAAGLTVQEARARYAVALAARMSLSRSERRVLRAATRWSTRGTSLWLSDSERDRVAKTLLMVGLWHGDEDPFWRLGPAHMGIESRVLLIAHAWAELTASGTDQLEHRFALLTLHNDPRRYDRRIVAIARELIPEPDAETRGGRVPHARELPRRIARSKLMA